MTTYHQRLCLPVVILMRFITLISLISLISLVALVALVSLRYSGHNKGRVWGDISHSGNGLPVKH